MTRAEDWIDEEVLIVVKACPTSDRAHREAVCAAGITRDGRWLRLYPIYYRTLPESKQFRKYDIVRLRTRKLKTDSRRESVAVDEQSIEVIDHLDTADNWRKRRRWVERLVDESMCGIRRSREVTGQSMGAFRPLAVDDLVMEAYEPDRRHDQVQLNLLDQNWRPAPSPKHMFKLAYRCSDPDCRGHEQTIWDWEALQLYRKLMRDRRPLERVLAAMKEKVIDGIFASTNNTLVFCGNLVLHPTAFIIGGFFYPKGEEKEQMTLF